jgi:hypothetical protein
MLLLRVYWVVEHHRQRLIIWLRCVPVGFSLIKLGRQRQLKPPLPDGLL